MRLLKVSFTLLVVFTLAIAAFTQTATSSLRGTVMDPKGGVVPGATVTLKDPAQGTSRETKTNDRGEYQFQQVPPATYEVTATAANVGTITQKGVRLLVATPSTLDLTVKLSGTTTTVEVVATAPVVNTTDASIGNAFDAQKILNLPFEGRNPVEILSLQPGVAYTGPADNNINTNFDSRNGAVNGERSDQNNITLDGIDNNDQNSGTAFSGALRTTLDSVQEFRVTTSNSNADTGRSAGAQVNLVTKSGTNKFHGSVYEYNRSSIGQANDWFNKASQVSAGQPNKPGKLVRNTYGAALGGPLWKDRLFFFGTFEAQPTRENTQVGRVVPSDNLRNGMISYLDTGGNVVTLSPAQFASMDPNCSGAGTCPLGAGANPNVLALFQSYPHPNTSNTVVAADLISSDGLNFQGYTFSAATPVNLNTYVAKLDYLLTQNGNHRLFLRGNLQDDNLSDAPQFPGQPPATVRSNYSKGLAGGYTAILSQNLINNFRYGYIRQSLGTAGIGTSHYIIMRGLDPPTSFARSQFVTVPVHNLTDDVTWTKGKHTWQFGGNMRIVSDIRSSTQNSFSDGVTNASWTPAASIANTGSSLDPAAFGFPAVSDGFQNAYDYPAMAMAGIISEVDAQYNFTINGETQAEGSPVNRSFIAHEYELYAQDSWRLKPNLTITAGLRYSILQPPYEQNGVQVAPTVSLEDWFQQRGRTMLTGDPFNQLITFDKSGQANGKKPYWGYDWSNLAPRVAIAYSPGFSGGMLGKLFGGAGKTSIRGGWGKYYDHFGEATVNTFDANGSFGLSTLLTNGGGIQTVDGAPRFTDLNTIPASITVPSPGGHFPTTFPADNFAVQWGLDDKMKTPYTHAFDFSITRELPGNFVVETAYVGRFARCLLQQDDLAMPRNVVDPSSKMDYFTAVQLLDHLALANGGAGVDESTVAPIPYWENLFGATSAGPGGAAGCAVGSGAIANPTATQNMYDLMACGLVNNETTFLQIVDGVQGNACFPGCATLNGVTANSQFFSPQFASLYSWRSMGNSSYNAGQLMLRHAMTHGLQFDFNYVYSKSIDVGSDAERITFLGGPGDQLFNAWDPKAGRSVSQFDTTHQINTNYVFELPFGQRRHWLSKSNRAVDAILGGWDLTGVWRWTSGFPVTIGNGGAWATNWELSGYATRIGAKPSTGVFIDASGAPRIFADPTDALSRYRQDLAGEIGERTSLRGPGYFGADLGLQKTFRITEGQTLKFAWETFNAFNTVRFDALSVSSGIDSSLSFGTFSSTLTVPRRMQFSLRYSF